MEPPVNDAVAPAYRLPGVLRVIIRIVKMEFVERRIPEFLEIFAASRDKIRSFPGCAHLRLLQAEADSCMFFTYSHWNREEDLEAYRNSDLFKAVWDDTRKLFRAPAAAWSLTDRTETVGCSAVK